MPIPAWSPPASSDQTPPAPEVAAEAPAAPAWEQPAATPPPAEPSPTDSAPTLVWQPPAAGEPAGPAEVPAAPGWETPATEAPAEGAGEAPAASPWEVPAASAAEPAAPEAPPAEPPVEVPPLDRTVFVDSTQVGGAAEHDTAGLPTLVEAELVVASGPDSGHTYRLTGPSLRIGRAPDNDLVLRDPATSGHHARVERRGNTFFVVDLGSTNGTLVNGDVVQERELKDGDSITIGQNAVNFAIRK